MSGKRALAVLLILVALGLIAGKILIEKRKRELLSYQPPKSYPVPAEYAVVEKGKLCPEVEFIGKVVPREFAQISTKVAGTVLKVTKREGESFKKGKLLVLLDSSELTNKLLSVERQAQAKESLLKGLEAQLAAARTALKNTEAEYRRELFLYKRGAVPKEAVEKAENAYSRAKAQVKEAESKIKELKLSVKALRREALSIRSSLNYTKMRAVKDGVVEKVYLWPGSVAVPGRPIMEVFYPESGLKVLVNLPPEEARLVVKGGTVEVNGKPLGTVAKLYPAAEPKSGLYTVEVALKENSRLKPNQLVKVKLPLRPSEGFIVPVWALLHLKGETVVLVFTGDKVEPVKVKVVQLENGKAVVLGKLREGQKVAVGRESKLLKLYRLGRGYPAEAFNG
ncbi:efflux RND transporter periplasmic adaptor subunit [Thermovibrio ammonificans]